MRYYEVFYANKEATVHYVEYDQLIDYLNKNDLVANVRYIRIMPHLTNLIKYEVQIEGESNVRYYFAFSLGELTNRLMSKVGIESVRSIKWMDNRLDLHGIELFQDRFNFFDLCKWVD